MTFLGSKIVPLLFEDSLMIPMALCEILPMVCLWWDQSFSFTKVCTLWITQRCLPSCCSRLQWCMIILPSVPDLLQQKGLCARRKRNTSLLPTVGSLLACKAGSQHVRRWCLLEKHHLHRNSHSENPKVTTCTRVTIDLVDSLPWYSSSLNYAQRIWKVITLISTVFQSDNRLTFRIFPTDD